MGKLITGPDDFTNPKARAMFMAFVNAFHGGDIQAAVAEHNKNVEMLDKIEARSKANRQPSNGSEVNLRFLKH